MEGVVAFEVPLAHEVGENGLHAKCVELGGFFHDEVLDVSHGFDDLLVPIDPENAEEVVANFTAFDVVEIATIAGNPVLNDVVDPVKVERVAASCFPADDLLVGRAGLLGRHGFWGSKGLRTIGD